VRAKKHSRNYPSKADVAKVEAASTLPPLCKQSKTKDPFVYAGQKRMSSVFEMTAMQRKQTIST
jgi:hypothetical protein